MNNQRETFEVVQTKYSCFYCLRKLLPNDEVTTIRKAIPVRNAKERKCLKTNANLTFMVHASCLKGVSEETK